MAATPKLFERMVRISGAEFLMGSDRHYPEEGPAHRVRVRSFWIDAHPVTNADFARFVDDTGYVTLAERPARAEDYPGAKPELLAPSSVVFRRPGRPVDLRDPYQWWAYVRGADWRHPQGPDSTIDGLAQHPVVHVAYEDAEAFAAWAGKALPTEAEWELAARGGLEGAEYVWGDEIMPDGAWLANWWQGRFPYENTGDDGYEGTSPVGAFPANGFGLYDMAGNVWEWTADWYQRHGAVITPCCAIAGAGGGTPEGSLDPQLPDVSIPRRVMKGGSHLCAPSYCHRFRPAARMPQPIDTSTCHLGLRCIVRE